jgi:Zn-dependent alcohol dehydrogenase
LLICITPPGSQAILDTSLFIRSRNFTRTSGGNRRPDHDFPWFVRWYRESKLKLDGLVIRRYALEQINEALDDLEHGRILGRAIITYARLVVAERLLGRLLKRTQRRGARSSMS